MSEREREREREMEGSIYSQRDKKKKMGCTSCKPSYLTLDPIKVILGTF